MHKKRKTGKNNWAETVKKDIDEINLEMSEDLISNTKKDRFKIHLKNKVQEAAFQYLLQIQQSHSKVKNIIYEKLQIQKYLLDVKFTTKEKQLLFKLRTRMTNVKLNFKSKHQNLTCNLCKDNILQSDNHLLQ